MREVSAHTMSAGHGGWPNVTAGQTWVNNVDGSTIVIEARSDLLARWWKVRSSALDGPRSIDEAALRTMYHHQPVDTPMIPGDARFGAEDSGLAAAV